MCHEGVKLGLGSSAAVTVAAVASVFHEAGKDIEAPAIRLDMWHVCKQAHDAFQAAVGSGADLAACLFGGIVAFRPDGPTIAPWPWPEEAVPVFVWTGRPASTPEMLRGFRGLRHRDPTGFRSLVAEMGAIVETLLPAGPSRAGSLESDAPAYARLVEAVRAYGQVLERMGQRLGQEVVLPQARAAARIAEALGGAAKPSGAGAGDMVVAVLPGEGAAEEFRRECGGRDLVLPQLAFAPKGVHQIQTGSR
jgi:phosphomevalonate kinase